MQLHGTASRPDCANLTLQAVRPKGVALPQHAADGSLQPNLILQDWGLSTEMGAKQCFCVLLLQALAQSLQHGMQPDVEQLPLMLHTADLSVSGSSSAPVLQAAITAWLSTLSGQQDLPMLLVCTRVHALI